MGALASFASSLAGTSALMFFTSVVIIVHRGVCHCRECLGLLGVFFFASLPVLCHQASQGPKTELNENQRLLENRTPVLTTDGFAPKETFRPLTWSVFQSFDDLVLHFGSEEATNVHPQEARRATRACSRLRPTPTSNVELHLAPRCAPKATTTVAHDPFLLQKSPTHRTVPPPRTAGATPLF